ncbi:hypothetical protein F2Q70_00013573 [Brassica cretica]|uniref:Uncharacterized protein n=1 Tax=Brassica cretica TaxID=69181 RepID=A0A8S9LVB0_BRACR|nr:hypothetical protein F2Q70_00013573 [Brassica cretica]
MGKNGSMSPLILRVRKRCERDESWMELKTSAELVNKVPDSEKSSFGSSRDPVSAPRASASEIELDAMIGKGRLVDSSCFTSSLEFVSVSLGFRELDSSKDFCVALGRLWWFDLDRGAVEMLLRSRNVRIVKWKIWEHLEILCGLIVLRRWRSNSTSRQDDMTEDRNEMVYYQLEILLAYVRDGRDSLPSNT